MSEISINNISELRFDLEAFDGPLDLLLCLIQKDEIDIYDIPIAEITGQYLNYLEACQVLNLEVAGEFLYMASLLIRIKAQILLPQPGVEEEWIDPRNELVNALLEYRRVKAISSSLENMAENRMRRFPRFYSPLAELPEPEPELVRVDLANLMIAFGNLLRRAPSEVIYDVTRQEITVAQRRQYILSLFDNCNSLDFDKLFSDDPRRIVMVVTFIALLELVRSGYLRVEQASRFSLIRVYMVNRHPVLVEDITGEI
jgi:segregation and condensation protein A